MQDGPLIRKLEQFAPLSPAARDALTTLPTRLREYVRGEAIIDAGAIANESAILMTGCVLRYKALTEGARQIVALQVPGDFIDLHSFVLKPIDHSVAAATTSLVARVPHEALEGILRDYPHLTRNLMWDMALDAAICREWMVRMGRHQAVQQIAQFICEFYLRMKNAGLVRNNSFEFHLTQEDVGDLCGLSSVHVNRSLQTLRKDGLVVVDRKQITVPDIAALTSAAQFDPAYLHLLE
jgi:CRP-like cAMP-binding protein